MTCQAGAGSKGRNVLAKARNTSTKAQEKKTSTQGKWGTESFRERKKREALGNKV